MIIDALAGTFQAQKNQVQALKTAAYAYTASWVAGVALILPLGTIIRCGQHLRYLSVLSGPAAHDEMSGRQGRWLSAVSIICAIVLGWIVMLIGGSLVGGSMMGGFSPGGSIHLGSSNGDVTIDTNSALGKLAAIGQKAEEAGKKMEQAQKSGDANAQAQAAGQ